MLHLQVLRLISIFGKRSRWDLQDDDIDSMLSSCRCRLYKLFLSRIIFTGFLLQEEEKKMLGFIVSWFRFSKKLLLDHSFKILIQQDDKNFRIWFFVTLPCSSRSWITKIIMENRVLISTLNIVETVNFVFHNFERLNVERNHFCEIIDCFWLTKKYLSYNDFYFQMNLDKHKKIFFFRIQLDLHVFYIFNLNILFHNKDTPQIDFVRFSMMKVVVFVVSDSHQETKPTSY